VSVGNSDNLSQSHRCRRHFVLSPRGQPQQSAECSCVYTLQRWLNARRPEPPVGATGGPRFPAAPQPLPGVHPYPRGRSDKLAQAPSRLRQVVSRGRPGLSLFLIYFQ